MEEKRAVYNIKFDIITKSELLFGPDFSPKINELNIFIYGLRGVNKYK